MKAVAGRVWVTAILNPYNGPGVPGLKSGDKVYLDAASAFRTAQGHVVGYLPSGYSGRQLGPGADTSCPATGPGRTFVPQDIIGCADRYQVLYPNIVEGVFIDEMNRPLDNSVSIQDSVAFYKAIRDGIKRNHPSWTIFGNPGAGVDPGYLEVADMLVTFEDAASRYPGTPPPSYHFTNPSTRFATIAHTAVASDFPAFLSLTRSRNVAYIYFLDQYRNYRFDLLPSNWASQVSQVEALNRSAARR